jgi:hypothetical protein
MRLRKRDVELLLARYDTDPVAALEHALQIALDRPGADFDELIVTLPEVAALAARDVEAMDRLAAHLNETRTTP